MDHQILFSLISRRIRDPKVLWLIQSILDTGRDIQIREQPDLYFEGDDLFAILRPKGLPIGNLTSQFWANVYLHELDMFVKQDLRCKAYLRYMDDFLLFSEQKSQLNDWKMAIKDFLGSRLRLFLHEKKSVVIPTRVGLDFCGYILFPDKKKLRRSSVMRFLKRYKLQRRQYATGQLSLEKMRESVQSWIAHAAHADTWRLRSQLFRKYQLVIP